MKIKVFFVAWTKPDEYTNDQSLTGNNNDNIHSLLCLLIGRPSSKNTADTYRKFTLKIYQHELR